MDTLIDWMYAVAIAGFAGATGIACAYIFG